MRLRSNVDLYLILDVLRRNLFLFDVICRLNLLRLVARLVIVPKMIHLVVCFGLIRLNADDVLSLHLERVLSAFLLGLEGLGISSVSIVFLVDP